jgi:hypothetical protein
MILVGLMELPLHLLFCAFLFVKELLANFKGFLNFLSFLKLNKCKDSISRVLTKRSLHRFPPTSLIRSNQVAVQITTELFCLVIYGSVLLG